VRQLAALLCCAMAATSACQTSSPPASTTVDQTQTGAATYSGGDGSSLENAVVVHAPSESVGVAASYKWIRDHLPGSRVTKQGLVTNGGRAYDSMEVVTESGEKRTIYFDISEYFGKF
jgi:hypothetical protein